MPTAPTSGRETVAACPACLSAEARPFAVTAAMMHASDETFSFQRCEDCGAVYLSPRVPAAQLGGWYPPSYLPWRGPKAWGRFAPLVAAGLRATDRRRVRRVLRHGAIGPRSRVLDVGCGRPTFLRALVDRTGCRAIGADVSDEGWKGDAELAQGLDLHTAELGDLTVADPVDLVTMWHYLEHDYTPRDTLRTVRSLARPGARLVVEVPDHGSWSRRRYGDGWAGYHTPRHTVLWDAPSLTRALHDAGWEVEAVEQTGSLDAWTLAWMSRQERRGIDWTASMERHFAGFLAGRMVLWPLMRGWERLRGRRGTGLLTAVARRPGD